MIVWTFIILVIGVFMLFCDKFIIENNMVKYLGLVITLICIGIGLRSAILGRKGEKEMLKKRIKELEEKLSELEKKSE
jgi:cadmium resistance protein CadD (predicted permease)